MIHFLLHKGGIGISVISEYKAYLWDYLSTYHNLKNPKQFFHCLNPEHNDNNPSMMFTDKYNICKCFACGTSYDIYDIIGLDYNLTDFREQLSKVKEIYLGYKPTYNNEYKLKEILEYNNYYYITGYKEPFKVLDKYKENIYFEDIFLLYQFDKKLKLIFAEILFEIEQKVKTVFTNNFCNRFGYKDKILIWSILIIMIQKVRIY